MDAVVAGQTTDGEPLYVGRVLHSGSQTIGKVGLFGNCSQTSIINTYVTSVSNAEYFYAFYILFFFNLFLWILSHFNK